MKNKLKFKSLTMRLWVMFTAIILIIVLSISLVYVFIISGMEEEAMLSNLRITHGFIKERKQIAKPPSEVERLDDLRFINHIVVSKGINGTYEINTLRGKYDQAKGSEFANDGRKGQIDWMASFIDNHPIGMMEFNASYNGQRFLFIVSPFENETEEEAYLISFMMPSDAKTPITNTLVIGVIFIIIGFAIAKLIANSIAKPLKELEDYTVKIAMKDWSDPLEVDREDELGRLGMAMNEMQYALKHAEQEEKMFLQSISHDLKTPVMVIMSYAEAIRDGIYMGTLEDTADTIKREAMRLERKIKQILYLNSLDFMLNHEKDITTFNLNELVNEIAEKFQVMESSFDWHLMLDMTLEEMNFTGNREKLCVAIENIVDNQMRYAESKIEISLRKDGEWAEIEIYNDGPHIDQNNIGKIFDNFYKDKKGNFGLGLAITKKIVDYHEGEVVALNRTVGVGFVVRVRCD